MLAAAERLYAEEGLGVSDRRVGQAAGQHNTAVVAYHFGSKAELVRALAQWRLGAIDELRVERLRTAPPVDLRAWLECLVLPVTEHAATLGAPTWHLRCLEQVRTDPSYAAVLQAESDRQEGLRAATAGLESALPALPPRALAARRRLTRLVLLHGLTDLEAQLAEGADADRARRAWGAAGPELVDALVGMWHADSTG